MRVYNIDYKQLPVYSPITCRADHAKAQAEIYQSYGILAPSWDELDIIYKGNMIIFKEEWVCYVYITYEGKNYKLTYIIHPGFICDKGSVPRVLRSIIDNDAPELLLAYFIHDVHYACRFDERIFADKLLKAIAQFGVEVDSNGNPVKSDATVKPALGVIKSNMVYSAVRIGGGSAWARDRMKIEREREFCQFNKLELTTTRNN